MYKQNRFPMPTEVCSIKKYKGMKLYKPSMEMKSVGTWRFSSILTTTLLDFSFCTKVYVILILQNFTYKHTYMCTCVHLRSFIHTQRIWQIQSVGIIFQMLEDKDSAFWWWGCGRGYWRNGSMVKINFYSSRGPEFSFYNLSQVIHDLMLSSAFPF